MDVALWDEPSTELLAEGIASTGGAVLHKMDRRACRDALLRGDVDIACLPTLTVFRDQALVDPLSVAALSSWNFPFARLELNQQLGSAIEAVVADPRYAQEILFAQILLKEHYNVRPAIQPVPADKLLTFSGDGSTARLLVNTDGGTDTASPTSLDLGQEWFELTHYPMVWGLFAARKGEGVTEQVRWLREVVREAEASRADVAAQFLEHEPFFREHLRLRLDDLATASLTALHDFLYYFNIVEELTPLSFVMAGEEADDDDEMPLL